MGNHMYVNCEEGVKVKAMKLSVYDLESCLGPVCHYPNPFHPDEHHKLKRCLRQWPGFHCRMRRTQEKNATSLPHLEYFYEYRTDQCLWLLPSFAICFFFACGLSFRWPTASIATDITIAFRFSTSPSPSRNYGTKRT